jgi:hypothetical protein
MNISTSKEAILFGTATKPGLAVLLRVRLIPITPWESPIAYKRERKVFKTNACIKTILTVYN